MENIWGVQSLVNVNIYRTLLARACFVCTFDYRNHVCDVEIFLNSNEIKHLEYSLSIHDIPYGILIKRES